MFLPPYFFGLYSLQKYEIASTNANCIFSLIAPGLTKRFCGRGIMEMCNMMIIIVLCLYVYVVLHPIIF